MKTYKVLELDLYKKLNSIFREQTNKASSLAAGQVLQTSEALSGQESQRLSPQEPQRPSPSGNEHLADLDKETIRNNSPIHQPAVSCSCTEQFGGASNSFDEAIRQIIQQKKTIKTIKKKKKQRRR